MKNSRELIASYPAPYHFDWRWMTRGAALAALTISSFMAAYFVLLQLFFDHVPALGHDIQYVLVLFFVNVFLINQKRNTGYEESFADKNFGAGATVSIFTAVLFFIMELVIYQFSPQATIQGHFGLEQANGAPAALIFASTAFETFVVGMLTTFIAFQYLKRPFSDSKTVQ